MVQSVCARWQGNECTNVHCPLRHPKNPMNSGGSRTGIAPSAEQEGKAVSCSTKINIKPLMDCSFFIQGNCKNGDRVSPTLYVYFNKRYMVSFYY